MVAVSLKKIFFKQKTAYEITTRLVGSEMCIRDRFDDLLERYTVFWTRKKVKTSDFGALFEVVYDIQMKEEAEQKAFLDAIRQRNGNLNISLTLAGEQEGTF